MGTERIIEKERQRKKVKSETNDPAFTCQYLIEPMPSDEEGEAQAQTVIVIDL